MPGGSFGVDAFFVLSGLLITSLLLAERHRTGRIDLRRFWAGRARRLLPALLLLLAAIAVYAATLAEPADRAGLRTDGLSALLYVANWHFAFSGQGYFAAFETQSPILHLWSLGVEEQFYLIWPLAVAALCLVRKGRRAVLLAAALGTAASTAALVVLNARHAEVSRLYYGTDTRAFTLLTGAGLAALLASGGRTRRRPWVSGRHARRLWALTGLVAAAGVGFAFARVDGQTPALYQGGFLVFALAAALVLASVLLAPRGPVARLLALAPLVALGRISYGLYLWHWPLFSVLSAQRTGLHGFALLATRLAATLTAAAASYLLVETPIRHGRRMLARPRFPRGLVAVTATVVTALALILATGRPPAAEPSYSDITSLAQRVQADNARRLAALQAAHPAAPTAPATAAGRLTPLLPPEEPERVLLMGDSLVFTLGMAMADRPALWRMDMLNSALIGCGLVQGQPAGAGDRSPAELSYCNSWPQRYQFLVDAFRPDVAVLLTGRWESLDWVIHGQRMSLGDPRYDQLVAGALDRAIDILTSRGAHVLLLTAPCYQRPERPDGSRWPEDSVSRVQRFNDLLRQALERHRGRAQLFDLYHWMCPRDSWQRWVDGYPVRSADGLHFDAAGGALLADRLLPVIRKVAGLRPTPGS